MMRAMLAAGLAAVVCPVPAHAQMPSGPLSANMALPNKRPQPLAAWVSTPNRSLTTLMIDGATMRGFRYHGTDPAANLTVLFFNGSTGTLNGAGFPPAVAGLGPDVVGYDYRGYGWSTGTADMMTMRQDALKEFDAVAADAGGPSHVVVMGYSFGTAFASYVASERPARGVVLISAFASLQREFTFYEVSKGRLSPHQAAAVVFADDARTAFDNVEHVSRSPAPLLVIHGADDDVVSADQGRDVFDASPSKAKRFVLVPGAKHDAPGRPESIAALKSFFAGLRT